VKLTLVKTQEVEARNDFTYKKKKKDCLPAVDKSISPVTQQHTEYKDTLFI
jgi:hypothetical protein